MGHYICLPVFTYVVSTYTDTYTGHWTLDKTPQKLKTFIQMNIYGIFEEVWYLL